MGSFTSDRGRKRGLGKTISVPKFEKNEQVVTDAQNLQDTVNTFFDDVENAVGNLQKEIEKAAAYAETIANLFGKLKAFQEPLNTVVNGSYPESVVSGAQDVKSQLNSLLEELKGEYERAKNFVENNSGTGSGGSGGSGGASTNSSLPSLDLSGRRGMAGRRGLGFEKNEELLEEADKLLKDLQQFEELPQPGGGGSAQVLIPLVNPDTGETVVAADAAEAEELKAQGFVEKGSMTGSGGSSGSEDGALAGLGGNAGLVLGGLGIAAYLYSQS